MFSAASASSGSSDYCDLRFEGDSIQFDLDTSSTVRRQLTTVAVFRDPAAWYHVVCAMDSDNATAASRLRIWVNNQEQTLSTTLDSGVQGPINNTVAHRIGGRVDGSDIYFSGYLADIHFIDGQALTPSSFTEVSATTGQLLPKAYSGSYGTNGFYLQFADNSSNTAATLGKDTSGNSNNWTPNNFVVSLGTQYSGASRFTFNAGTTGWYNSAPHDLFDGSLSTALSATNGNQPGAGYTWDATGLGLSGTLRVYTYGDGGNGTTVTVNGTTSLFTSSIQWLNFGNVGAINTIKCSRLDQGVLFAIEVNGSQLVENVSSDIDSLVDTPTSYGTPDTGVGNEVRGNYATLNPLYTYNGTTLRNGNLDFLYGSGQSSASATMSAYSGKYYCEMTPTTINSMVHFGVFALGGNSNGANIGAGQTSRVIYLANGAVETTTQVATYATYTTSDVIGIALNLDASPPTVAFYKNGSLQGTINLSTSFYNWTFAVLLNGGGDAGSANFGQRAFAYTAPSGFKALCDTNLPAPVVAKPNTVMDVALFTGNGSSQNVTGLNFAPDFVWAKKRSAADSHLLFDVIRGATVFLGSDTTNGDQTLSSGLTAFNSDGFSWGSYGNGATFVGWAWDAGTTTASNGSGSITSQVRANASAGFSVVTYTAGASNATVGHGLGVAPSFIIVKSRTATDSWVVYHSALGKDGYLHLNLTNAFASNSNYWGTATPNSTVFGLANSGFANNNGNMVAYAFAPVVGYSSFGSYTGNGSTDGPFVYTGFRPKWLMIKVSSAVDSWAIKDSARGTYNPNEPNLYADLSIAEQTSNPSRYTDFVSNGFKLRGTDNGVNSSGNTYIYAAFAESPFQFSRAR